MPVVKFTFTTECKQKNSRGPRIEPCGTPAHLCFGSEITPGFLPLA